MSELREQTPEARLRGITFLILLIVGGLAVYLLAAMKFLPELGIYLLGGAAFAAALMVAGPRFTMPLYFGTWFCGSAIYVGMIPVSLNKVAAATFVLSSIVFFLRRPFRIPAVAPLFLLSGMTIYAVIFGFLNKPADAPVSIHAAFYLATALLVASAFRTRDDFRRLMTALFYITCVISFVGAVEFALRRDLFPGFSDERIFAVNLRINGVSRNAIQFAFNACWIMPWALFLLSEARKGREKIFILAGLFLLIVVSILTFNRQTPIILGAMLTVTVFFLRSPMRRRLAILLGAGALLFAPYITMKMVDRFQGLDEHGSRDVSIVQRQDKFKIAMNMLEENPWTGVGLDNYRYYWYPERTTGELYRIHFEKGTLQYIDLGYMQLLTETGFIGFTIFLLVGGTGFIVWRRWRKRALRGGDMFLTNGYAAVAGGFTQLGVSLLIQDTFFFPHTFLLFGLFFCLVGISRQTWKEKEQISSNERAATPQ